MEEDLNEDDGQEESREYYFSSKNPLTKYCFVMHVNTKFEKREDILQITHRF